MTTTANWCWSGSTCEHFPDCDREATYLAVNENLGWSGRFCYYHYPKPLWGFTITYIGKEAS